MTRCIDLRLATLAMSTASLLFAPSVWSAETTNVFDDLIQPRTTRIATGESQTTQHAPSVTTIITAQEIEAMGARTFEDVLRTVPGIFVVSHNSFAAPIYIMRGIPSITRDPEILFMINGVRMNAASTGSKGGSAYWGGFPISAISRVEVLRGPGSAVHGSDAFAGVINIITKDRADIDGTEIGVRVGEFDTYDGWWLHSNEWEGFEIAVMASANHTNGQQRTVESDAQTQFDQQFGTDASLAPGPFKDDAATYDFRVDISKDLWRFRAGVHQAEDLGMGLGAGQALDPQAEKDEQRVNLDLIYHNPEYTDNWEVEAQFNYFHLMYAGDLMVYPPGAFGGAFPIGFIGRPEANEHNLQTSLSGFYHGFAKHTIRVGAGYMHQNVYRTRDVRNFGINPFTMEQIDPNTIVDVSDTFAAFLPEKSRNIVYAYLQDSWAFAPQWALTAGVRYDKYSDFGDSVNPRLGLVWNSPADTLVLKLLYGSAFRAPAFEELYFANNPVTQGNPDLDAEKIQTWEFAVNYRPLPTLNFDASFFYLDSEDKIFIVPLSETEGQFANVGNLKGQGAEFEVRWKLSDAASVLLNYSYQDIENDNSSQSLHNSPEHMAYLRADYLLGGHWYVDGQVHWHGDWSRVAGDPRPAIDATTTVDLTLRYKTGLKNRADFALGVRNIADEDVRYPSPGPDANGVINVPNDIPGAGRFFFGELRYRF